MFNRLRIVLPMNVLRQNWGIVSISKCDISKFQNFFFLEIKSFSSQNAPLTFSNPKKRYLHTSGTPICYKHFWRVQKVLRELTFEFRKKILRFRHLEFSLRDKMLLIESTSPTT